LSSIKNSEDVDVLKRNANDLIELVKNFEKGSYYGNKLQELLEPPSEAWAWILEDPRSEALRDEHFRNLEQEYREQLRRVASKVENLIVEMLNYQHWS